MTILQQASRRIAAPILRRNTVNNITRRTMMAFEDHARLRVSLVIFVVIDSEKDYMTQKTKWHLLRMRRMNHQNCLLTLWFHHFLLLLSHSGRHIKISLGQIWRGSHGKTTWGGLARAAKIPASSRGCCSQATIPWQHRRTRKERSCCSFGKDWRFDFGPRFGESCQI